MEIIVINQKIETRNIVQIVDIKDVPTFNHKERDVGFIIYFLDGSYKLFSEFIMYGTQDEVFEETKQKYKILQNKVEEKWKEDSHNLPTFNL